MTEKQEYFIENFPSDFKAIFTMPENYDPRDRETVLIFGKRLKYLLETAEKRNKENEAFYSYDEEHASWNQLPIGKIKQCLVFTEKDLATALGVTKPAISQYINGRNGSVPDQYFFRLYEIFGVTPHFLTGYVDDVCERLVLDDERRPVYENGQLCTKVDSFTHGMFLERYAYYQFETLLYSSFERFSIFSDFLSADRIIQDGGFAILKAYLDSHKAVARKSKETKKNQKACPSPTGSSQP